MAAFSYQAPRPQKTECIDPQMIANQQRSSPSMRRDLMMYDKCRPEKAHRITVTRTIPCTLTKGLVAAPLGLSNGLRMRRFSCVSGSSVILWSASHFRLRQAPKRRAGSAAARLLSLLLPGHDGQGKSLQPKLPILKCLFDDRAALSAASIIRGGFPAPAKSLQRGFPVPTSNSGAWHFPRANQRVYRRSIFGAPSHRPIDTRPNYSFERAASKCPVFPTSGLLFGRAQGEDVRPNVVAEQTIRGPEHLRAATVLESLPSVISGNFSTRYSRGPENLIRHRPKIELFVFSGGGTSTAYIPAFRMAEVGQRAPQQSGFRNARPAAPRVAHQIGIARVGQVGNLRFINLEQLSE